MTADVLDPEEWFRVGSGRRQELPSLSTAAVVDALADLPSAYGPYVLVAHQLVPGDQGYVSDARVVELDDLPGLVEEGVWQYFIISIVLSSALLARLPHVDAQTLATNGAINLQMGRRTRVGPQPPSLGLVRKVATKDGQVREHREYADVFESALRLLRRSR